LHTIEQLKTGQLKGIQRLQLQDNLTQFPSEILQLADTLEILDMSNNRLSSLPNDFDRLHKLKILFLSNNQFEHLPTVLGKCANLDTIAFKANRIKTVHGDALPPRTRWLILTDNDITTLPERMGQLHGLKKLALAGNKLTSLPNSMANCHHLELIRLSANRFESFPDWLFELPKLAWCALSGNPAVSPKANHLEDENTPSATDQTHTQILSVKGSDIQLDQQIGEGASGVIHQATWVNPPKTLSTGASAIAVKLFKGEITSDGYPADELNCCLATAGHENLIKVVAQIKEPKQLGLVMELIPANYTNLGQPPSLQSCTRDTFEQGQSLHIQNVHGITRQMASTMAHMHQQGVSHGDLYAHNTMTNPNGDMLFGDFGAASQLSALPQHQQQGMEKVEVRALGYLMDDLLTLANSRCAAYVNLVHIKDQCLQQAHQRRPSFRDVIALLPTAHHQASTNLDPKG